MSDCYHRRNAVKFIVTYIVIYQCTHTK